MSALIETIFTKVPRFILLLALLLLHCSWGSWHLSCERKQLKTCDSQKNYFATPFMSTGALMFVFEEFRVAPLQIAEALIIGALFSIILIKTTAFEKKEDGIYVKRSKAFLFILLGLLIIRLVGKLLLSNTIDVGELGGMFWILAFGMIVPWRIGMLAKFNQMNTAEQ